MVELNEDQKNKVIFLSKSSIKEAKSFLALLTGTGASQTNKRYRQIMRESIGDAKFDYSEETSNIIVNNSELSNLDEVLKATKVNLNEWQVDKYAVSKETRTIKNNGVNTIIPRFDFRISLKRKQLSPNELYDKFVKLTAEHKIDNFKFNKPLIEGRLLEICVTDIHYAMLTSEKQTRGANYDVRIASEEHKNAVYRFVEAAKANGVKKIILPCGGDAYNSDNMAGTTTAGTAQSTSEDSRWQKVFTTVCSVHSEIIETLAKDFEVEVVIVNGNHDFERCYYLGEFLRAFFRNHPNVKIDNSPTQRKYYTFGTNLIMWTHGSEEKHVDLPLIMATEAKNEWSRTTCREIHVGHIHQHRSSEKNGVITRVITPLCPPSNWATSKGYVGNYRGSEAFLYDKKDGLIAQFYHRW